MRISIGKCHICRERSVVKYCKVCGHWFCPVCRKAWFRRGIAAVRELIGGPSPDCCGVIREVEIELDGN